MTDATFRLGLFALVLVPLLGVAVWSVLTAPETAPEAVPEPEPMYFTTEEYETGDVPRIPEDSEAMAQIRAAMAGQIVRCAVCHGTVGQLYRVTLRDNAAFCCGPCSAILNAGSLD
jgi:mono/diheme cytochrome c family protein